MLRLHAARSFGTARTRAQSVARAAVSPSAGTSIAARHARAGTHRHVVTAAALSARLSEATKMRSGIGGMMWMTASRGLGTSARASRPNAAALDPRQLTAELGRARDLPELLSLHRRHGDDFDGMHIGAFWSRFKALARGERGKYRDSLAPVCEQTARMLPELNARAVANVAHAFAKARLVGTGPWESVWEALPEAVRRLRGSFNPQDLSNTAWAFATAGHASPELFNAISAEAVRRQLGGFNEQDLSNTAWAFAKVGHASSALFGAISEP